MSRQARPTRGCSAGHDVTRDVAKALAPAVTEYVRRALAARARQGLPDGVEDVGTLHQVARLLSGRVGKQSRSRKVA